MLDDGRAVVTNVAVTPENTVLDYDGSVRRAFCRNQHIRLASEHRSHAQQISGRPAQILLNGQFAGQQLNRAGIGGIRMNSAGQVADFDFPLDGKTEFGDRVAGTRADDRRS